MSLFILFYAFKGMANTYYVSNSGNDNNNGTNIATPWASLSKVNSINFTPGTQILFQRGGTWYGQINLQFGVAGTLSNPIVIGAYGSGSNPVITGFTTISSWKNLGSNIWESSSPVSTLSGCNMVLINGINTPMGCYPQSGFLTMNSATLTSISCTTLTGTPNWTGAQAAIRTSHYTIGRCIVTSQSGSTLYFSSTGGAAPPQGYGFILENSISTLTYQNAWFYNSNTGYFYIYSTSQPNNIQLSSIEFLVGNNSYITYQNLTFTGANSAVFWGYNQSHININNCTMKYIGVCAVNLRGSSYLTISNDSIYETNNCGIDVSNSASDININNNYLNHIGQLFGMNNGEFNGQLPPNCGISARGYLASLIIKNNTILNNGFNAISFYTDTGLIQNNFIDTFCTVLSDGGGIYTFTGFGNTLSKCIKITGNIVLNGGSPFAGADTVAMTNGIYMDNNSGNGEIFNNTVGNVNSSGIFLNWGYGNENIHNNTVYNSGHSQLYITSAGFSGETVPINNKVKNNLFIAKSYNTMNGSGPSDPQFCVEMIFSNNLLGISYDSSGLRASTILDSNYYARPIHDDYKVMVNLPKNQYMTLPQWQLWSHNDLHTQVSSESINSINDINFFYNPTSLPLLTYLPYPMISITGTRYEDSILLAPYGSAILLKDYNPPKYTKLYINICNGNNYNGWTTTGTYNLNLTSKSGADSIIIIYLTVNPSYNIVNKVTIKEGESYFGWNTTGIYTQTLTTVLGCDSVITTNLTVLQPINTSQNITICNGDNYNGWSNSGIYTQNFTSKSGADSTVTTYLTVNPTYNITQNISIITGQNYLGYTKSGIYINNLTTKLGCDSIISTNLTVLPPYNSVQKITTCNGNNYNGWTNSGTYIDTFITKSNADSIVTTYLIVYPIYDTIENITIFNGQNYMGFSITGEYTRHLISKNGCDSIITTNLIVEPTSDLNNVYENTELKQIVSVFPNPTTGLFTIHLDSLPSTGSFIEVFDINGQKIISHTISDNSLDLDLSGQAPGLYIIKTNVDSQIRINKLILQN